MRNFSPFRLLFLSLFYGIEMHTQTTQLFFPLPMSQHILLFSLLRKAFSARIWEKEKKNIFHAHTPYTNAGCCWRCFQLSAVCHFTVCKLDFFFITNSWWFERQALDTNQALAHLSCYESDFQYLPGVFFCSFSWMCSLVWLLGPWKELIFINMNQHTAFVVVVNGLYWQERKELCNLKLM